MEGLACHPFVTSFSSSTKTKKEFSLNQDFFLTELVQKVCIFLKI